MIDVENKRLVSLDILRGAAVAFILFFHSSIFNYANIHKIDFSNPPILIVLMSFMALWGGIFIIYSSVVNSYMLAHRVEGGTGAKAFLHLLAASVMYLAAHYALNYFLGRWANDFVNNQPDYSAVAGSLRNMRFTMPGAGKFLEGSSISTIAINLALLAPVAYLLLRAGGAARERRNYLILGVSGVGLMLLSFVRVQLYPLFEAAAGEGSFLARLFFSLFLANPYPLIPYLAYGLLGMMIGLMLHKRRMKLIKAVALIMGSLFFIYGVAGMMNFEKSISAPDYFWYFKTNFELGTFVLMLAFALLVVEPRAAFFGKLSLIRWFSRVSITIYMLETTTSELFRLLLLKLTPGWNETINGCLLFGFLNVVIWALILWLWSRVSFKYSLEYWWIRIFGRIGKESTKMEGM